MPVTRVGVQAVTGSPGQIVDIDPARISATITNVGTVAVEYSTGAGWTSIAAGGSASISCDTHDLRLRRTGSGAYPAPVDIDWTAQSEGEANSLTALQAAAVSGDGKVPQGADWRAMQDALNGGRLTMAFDVPSLTEPLLIGSDTRIDVLPGVNVVSGGARFHNMLRVGNADYLNSQHAIEGTWVYCADEQAAYLEGTLTYTHPAATLTWQPDGQPAGAAVSVAAVVNGATSAIFEIPSGTGGASLYVVVVPAAARNSTRSRRVRIEPTTGARPATWTRASGSLVVNLPGNSHRAGALVQLFGASVQGHFFIDRVDGDSLYITDARADAAGSCRVYGVGNVVIQAAGSLWDGNRVALASAASGLCTHAWLLHTISFSDLCLATYTRATKYACYLSGTSSVEAKGLRITGPAATNSDGVHFTGPSRDLQVLDTSGTAGDNLVGFGSADYLDYCVFFPSGGTLDVVRPQIRRVRGEESKYELVRAYCANAGWLRDVLVEDVGGTCDSNTTSGCVSITTDNGSGNPEAGATNVDGFTVRNVTARRADGNHIPKFVMSGTGTRRRIVADGVALQPNGRNTAGSVRLDCAFDDVTVRGLRCDTKFAGPAIQLAGSADGKLLIVEDVRFTGDSQVTGWTNGAGVVGVINVRPTIVEQTGAGSKLQCLRVSGVDISEDSSAGARTTLIIQNGLLPLIQLSQVRLKAGATNPDGLVRVGSTATGGGVIQLSGVDSDADFGVVTDGPLPSLVQMGSLRHTRGNTIHNGSATVAGYDLQFGADVQVANALNVPVAGPLFRLRSSSSIALDGTRLDATVANHAPGASFYNTAAGFGAGVGQYVRGATSWTRVAA